MTSTVTLMSGREMPVLGLGTWHLTQDVSASVERAFDLGYLMVDTAPDYYTQPGIGRVLARRQADVYVVTKVEKDEDGYEATVRNLKELDVDSVDLSLIHRPPSKDAGISLWRGLISAREDGLTADIGVSNFSAAQIEVIADATGEMPAVNQIEWTPFGWSEGMLEFCRTHGIVIQAYSPLTRGRRLADDRLRQIAGEYNKTTAQVLLRWCIQRGVVPLPKAAQPQHLVENLDVFDFELSTLDMTDIGALNEHWSALGNSLSYT